MNFNRLRKLPIRRFSRTIEMIRGSATKNQKTNDITLRGIKLNSNYEDNPNMLFFVDYFDKPENWLTFFMQNGTLNHRNVYILNNPNFGNSDHSNENDMEAIDSESTANAVERFMWQNKISTATMSGHGFGARTALLMGCYRSEMVTGVAAFDYTPTDYTNFDVVWRLKTALKALDQITDDMSKGKMNRTQINKYIEDNVLHPKMQALFKQNVLFLGNNSFGWDFNMNLVKNHLSHMVNWRTSMGLYPGRANFIFPEYSDYVFLNTHTNAMRKIAVRLGDYFQDIQCEITNTDEPYSNHFVYECENLSNSFSLKLNRFLHMYDGVHTLLMNRGEVYERKFIPQRIHELKESLRTDAFPNHFHHNWRYRTE